jgi:Fe-S-cluster containining protein
MGRKEKGSVRYVLRVPTATGKATVEARVPRGPMRLAELVPLAQRFTDVAVEQAIKLETQEGRPLSCAKGCAACCRQIVPISAPEAFRLADAIIALPEPRRDAVLARFDAAESELLARGMLARLDALIESDGGEGQSLGALAADYFALQMACPILEEGGECGVRGDRPLSCRDYNVSSPAAWCASPGLYTIRKIPTPPLLSQPLARVAARLTGAAVQLIPLAAAMRWVDQNAELGMQTWPGTELFTAWLAELGIKDAVPEAGG